LAPYCGDGNIDGGDEVCDDGMNDGSYNGCAEGCQSPGPFCGDNMANYDEGEECDGVDLPANVVSCNGDCQLSCEAMFNECNMNFEDGCECNAMNCNQC